MTSFKSPFISMLLPLIALFALSLQTSALAAKNRKIDGVLELKNDTGGVVHAYRIKIVSPVKLDFDNVKPSITGTAWEAYEIYSVDGDTGKEYEITWFNANIAANAIAKMKFELLTNRKVRITESTWLANMPVGGGPATTLEPVLGKKRPPAPTQTVVGDPQYFISYELDPHPDNPSLFRIDDLQFVSNVPEVPLGGLSYNSPGLSFDSPRSPFDLAFGEEEMISVSPERDSNMFLYAQGRFLDPANDEEIGTFVFGSQAVPEPATLVLLVFSCLACLASRWIVIRR